MGKFWWLGFCQTWWFRAQLSMLMQNARRWVMQESYLMR
uniref:Uncharacterized protein n=1 Tax=Rhizophora mucronata TaxID=61149 RepID=A0A2P2PMK0_RHIMU